MEKEQPSYYAVIPANVRYDSNLKPNEKLLYGELTALSTQKGYCYATNNYFAKNYGVSTRSITEWLANLQSRGYIEINTFLKTNGQHERHIKIVLTSTPQEENFQPPQEENFQPPQEENFYHNNTSINNTSINNKRYSRVQPDTPSSKCKIEYQTIIDYLNENTGSRYKATTPKTQSLIKARINEGFTVEDFKKVIDNKMIEWQNDEKMKRYLRPETLFGTKFEGYLNQQVLQSESGMTLEDWNEL